jgi:hypothetical protein
MQPNQDARGAAEREGLGASEAPTSETQGATGSCMTSAAVTSNQEVACPKHGTSEECAWYPGLCTACEIERLTRELKQACKWMGQLQASNDRLRADLTEIAYDVVSIERASYIAKHALKARAHFELRVAQRLQGKGTK